jgi:uracil-DNA glycosylase family 4
METVMDLEPLNARIRNCRRCRLCETRTNALCGEGNPEAELMFVAQAPGEVEDREGRMFLGPSGRAFFELLGEAGISREAFYMTNLLKCRLPHNRKPRRDEIDACRHYLDAEIDMIRPKLLVPLGYYATRALFEKYGLPWPSAAEKGGLFGTVHRAGVCCIYPLRHPAALLYNPALKAEMAGAYRRLKGVLEACGQ